MSREKIEPKCCNNDIQFAITNRGHLVPCCYVDSYQGMKDPFFQKLLTVSKITDYDSLEEILQTKEWKELEQILLGDGPYPSVCAHICKKRNNNDAVKLERLSSHNNTKIEERKH